MRKLIGKTTADEEMNFKRYTKRTCESCGQIQIVEDWTFDTGILFGSPVILGWKRIK